MSRLSSKKFSVGSNSVADNYSYLAGANGNTATLVSDYAISRTANGANSNFHKYSYTHDKNGNILTISDSGTLKAKYTYDELNELTREDNAVLNKSIVYSYDADGNLVYMNLNGSLYYYERNAQNNIMGLIDTNMSEVVTYSY